METLRSSRLADALNVAIQGGGPLADLAKTISSIAPDLGWYRSRTGPFASINFVRGHAHALIVGPGGMEERDDVHIGATVMAPYGRYPDHRRKHLKSKGTVSPHRYRRLALWGGVAINNGTDIRCGHVVPSAGSRASIAGEVN
ncbi:dimethylsulfonioproprionate lyase family protein [Ensifer sp. Root423]